MATRAERTETVLAVLRGEQSESEACRRLGIASATYRDWERRVLAGRHSDHEARLADVGLGGHARIVRDRWGVPHCYAESLGDLCFAAGVAQAQDRLWQLDYRRRLAGGRLAEILGAGRVDGDRESRAVGFRRIVKAVELPRLTAEAAEALSRYADGVNAWMARVWGTLPIEFDLLGYAPEPWTPADSLAVMRHFWWTLTGRLSQLVAAERLLRRTSAEVAAWFLTPETVSYIVPDWRGADGGARGGAAPGGAAVADSPADTPGSNNWVAGPGRLARGGPVLAADPHWPVFFPDMWYEQHLCGAGMDVIGPAYPGAPPVVFGRTRGLAWGRTNNVTSTRDLYHEEIDPDDPNRYRTREGWESFRVVEERIAVRGGDPVTETVRLTANGRPVVNDFIPRVAPGGDGPITLRWVGQEEIGDVQVLLDLGRTNTVAEAREVFGRWRLSLWNGVLADAEGHFGYQMCGSVPERKVATRGTRPAADPDHEWTGYRNTPQLPGDRDPARGWVATANNPPAPPEAMDGLYGTYADGYRHDRIARFLGARDDLTPPEVGGLQDDNLSLRAEDLAGPAAALLAGAGGMADAAARLLRGWNHRFDPDQAGATVWAALWPRLVRRVGEAALDDFSAELNAGNAGRLTRHLLLGGEAPGFFGGDIGELARAAAADATEYLAGALGPAPEGWTWGGAQVMALRHPAAASEAARRVLEPPAVVCAGGPGAVHNRAGGERDTGFVVTGGPSYRFACDLSESHALGSLLAGQSAQAGHRHALDQLELWPRGEYHPLLMDADEIARARRAETVLAPVAP